MKKFIKSTLVVLSLLLVLVGCSSSALTQVTESEEVFADIKGKEITKGDIYEYSKLRFGLSLVKDNLIKMQVEKHVELSEDEMNKAKEQLAESKEKMGDNFEAIIKASGYNTEDEYFEKVIVGELKRSKLFEIYTSEYLEDITKTLQMGKVRQLITSTKAEAEAALEELKAIEDLNNDKFVELATKYNTNTNEDFVIADVKFESVYEGRTENKFLNTYLAKGKPGLLDEIIMTDGGFTILYFEEIDYEADKDAIIASINANDTVLKQVQNSMYATYSSLGNFQIHDKDIYEEWKNNNPFITK